MLKVISRPEMWNARDYPITVAEITSVAKRLDAILTEDERAKIVDCLAFNPTQGEMLVESCGIRLFKFRGKRSGRILRLAYYFRDLNMPLYVVALYERGERIKITPWEEMQMRQLVEQLVAEYASRNRNLISGHSA